MVQCIGRYTFHCLVTVSNINYQCTHYPSKGQHRNTSHGWLARLHASAIAHIQLSNFRVCRRLILPCFGVQSFAMSRSKLFALSSCPYPITSACFCQALFCDFLGIFLDTSETRSSGQPLALYGHIVNRSLMLSNTIMLGHNRRLSLFAVHPVCRPSLDCVLSIPYADKIVNLFFCDFLFFLRRCYWDSFLLLIRARQANDH